MSGFKRTLISVGQALRLQMKAGKKVIYLEVLAALAVKSGQLIEILLPALLLDLLLSEKTIQKPLLCIEMISIVIPVLNYITRKSRNLLSAYASRNINYVMLSIHEKKLSMDYQDIQLSENLNKEEKAKSAIDEVLETDYILFHEILGAVFAIAMTGYLIVQMDAAALLIILLAAILHYCFMKKKNKADYQYHKIQSKLKRKQAYIEELLFNARYGKDIRVYNGAGLVLEKFHTISLQMLEANRKRERRYFIIQVADALVYAVQLFFVYVLAVYKYLSGNITLGLFTFYINAAKEISTSVTELLDAVASLVKVNAYFHDYQTYLETEQTIDFGEQEFKAPIADSFLIEFKQVSFCYPNSTRNVLDNISLTIKSGEKISIVGENGAGKTTLIYLLLRLLDPTEGCILLNGIDIRNIPYAQYRQYLSPIFQDYELFAVSLQENVVLNQPYNAEALRKSYQFADLEEKIQSLPQGDATILTKDLSEEGEEMSGGEKQKLALARAHYHNGNILILDEPTAAIDALSEHNIYCHIAEAYNKTIIFISHRMTSTIFSDKVIVLENGKLVQMGMHRELVAQKGIYRDMFCKQSWYYQENLERME